MNEKEVHLLLFLPFFVTHKMENFIRFLVKSSTFLEFLLLEALALFFVVSSDGFQKNVLISSCNSVVASVYDAQAYVEDYFSLREQNAILAEENASLYTTVQKELIQDLLNTQLESDFDCISAKVIYNSLHKFQNYIVINKGSADGVAPEMGVINNQGVVGVIKSVSEHYSVVLPILNNELRLSCRLKKGDYFGSLIWKECSSQIANLEEIPHHVLVAKGDSVVTSGFSEIFPSDILVGVVEEASLKENAANVDISVRLACDFQAVKWVKVIAYEHREELEQIISTIEKDE